MGYTLSCKDTGIDCPFVARGETEAEVLQQGMQHMKEVHGHTEEEMKDPKFIAQAKSMIKKESPV
jgi:predicted small metal-binding protein